MVEECEDERSIEITQSEFRGWASVALLGEAQEKREVSPYPVFAKKAGLGTAGGVAQEGSVMVPGHRIAAIAASRRWAAGSQPFSLAVSISE